MSRARVLALVAGVVFVAGAYKLGRYGYAEYHVQSARAAVERGDVVAARPHLEVALRERPDSGPVAFLAARAARRGGELPAAGRHLERAGRLGYDPAAVELEKLLLRAETGDFRAVEPQLRALDRGGHPDAALVREVLVPGYIATYQLGDAYQVLEPWVMADPNNARARLWMYDVAKRLEITQLAVDSARAAVGLAPDDPAARLAAAEVLIKEHQAAEALPHFQWLLDRRPDDPQVAVGLARCHKELGAEAEAVRVLDDLLRRHPAHPQGLAVRGLVELDASRPEAALPWLRQAVALTPGDPDVVYQFAKCLGQCGKEDEAKVWRERQERAAADLREMAETVKAIVKEPRNPDLRYKAGSLMLRNGHEAEGVRWLHAALAEDPNHRPARAALDEYYKKKK